MLLNTIRHAGRKIFLHFHDASVFKEVEHPRGEAGKFVKKGTATGPKPTAAKGAVVVNPVAKVLKEHGYVKQKGGNIYQHSTGHEVEVHAASEGQKWLTGWTHGTSGQTGSGAGKLSKHLLSFNPILNAPTKKEKEEPPTGEYKTGQFKPSAPAYPGLTYGPEAKHPSGMVHNAMTVLGFEPVVRTEEATTYEHPTKGAVRIDNHIQFGNTSWKYYKNKNDTEPTTSGEGISGGLVNTLKKYHPDTPYLPVPSAPTPTPTPTAPPHPQKKVHNKLTEMGYEPTLQTANSTFYTHPTKSGIIDISNTPPPKSGPNKGKIAWKFFASPGDNKPIETGKGIVNGNLEKVIASYSTETPSAPAPPTSGHAFLPNGGNKIYSNYEEANWAPPGGTPEPADRHFSGSSQSPDESLVIGTGKNNKGQWQIWQKGKGSVAQGTGQQSLNEAFEKLHPRGAGGKFVAKPGSQEEQILESMSNNGLEHFANGLTNLGWKPTANTTYNYEFRDPDGTLIQLDKQDPESWELFSSPSATYKHESGFGLQNLKKTLAGTLPPPKTALPETTEPLSVSAHLVIGTPKFKLNYYFPQSSEGEEAYEYQLADNKDLVIGQSTGNWEITGPNSETLSTGQGQQELNQELSVKTSGVTVVKHDPNFGHYDFASPTSSKTQYEQAETTEFSNGLHLVKSKESDNFLIIDDDGLAKAGGSTQQELDAAIAKHLGGATAPTVKAVVPPPHIQPFEQNLLSQNHYFPAGQDEKTIEYVLPDNKTLYVGQSTGVWEIESSTTGHMMSYGVGQLTLNQELPSPATNKPLTPVGKQIIDDMSAKGSEFHDLLMNAGFEPTTMLPAFWKFENPSSIGGFAYIPKDDTSAWILTDGDGEKHSGFGGVDFTAKLQELGYLGEVTAGGKPAGVSQEDNDKLVAAGYKFLGKAPWGKDVYVYGKDDGSIVLASTEPSGLPGSPTVFPAHPTVLKDDQYLDLLTQMLGGVAPKVGEVPPTPHVPSPNTMTGLYMPLKDEGFTTTTNNSDSSVTGILMNDPNGLKAAYTAEPTKGTGVFAWQLPGENGQNENYTGTPFDIFNKIKNKLAEIKAKATESPADKAEHWTLQSPLPKELNGVAFSHYKPPADWSKVEGQNEHLQEPQMPVIPGKKPSAGLLIEEPDGRIWIVKPKNAYGGVEYTFPKGGQEPGQSLQATAIKEAFEESGIKAEITGFAGDYQGDTSITRYYLAKRTGGTPTGHDGQESEQVSLIPRSELGKYLNKARDLQIMKDHLVPKALGRSIHLESMKKIGEKKGSNPGGIYQTESGKKYYVKLPKTELHTKNELLAADLMSRAGGGTLKYHPIIDKDGKLNVGTEWEELQKDNVSKLTPAEKKKAQKDFAINAWLANWDAAGTGGDNTGILNGKAVTLDVGGALLFRAQGGLKAEAFGNDPGEWETMRFDKVKNPDSVALYGDMTPEQLKESTEKLNNVTNEDIATAVHAHFDADDPVAHELIDKLIARRDKLISYGAVIQVAPPPQPKPAVTAPPPTPKAPTPPPSDVYPKQHSDGNWSGKPEYLKLLKVAPPPTKKQGYAIDKYTGGSYRPWNLALRQSTGTKDEGYPTRDLMQYLANSSMPEDRVVKRRVDDDFADWLIGQAEDGVAEYTDHGFSSTDHWSGKLTLYIKVPQGAQAAAVGNYSANHTEDEIIINAGSHFRILDFNPKSLTMNVELVRSGMAASYAKKLGRPAGIVHKKTIGL